MNPRLDLHGKRTDEVEELVDHFLFSHSQRGTDRIEIMTGKGEGKVQKVVIDYLRKGHYNWAYKQEKNGKQNTGILVVFMK